MDILIVGSGGREHALAWKIARSPLCSKIYCAPGNAGIENIAECVNIAADDIPALKAFALHKKIGLTVVGPELPLTLGIVDSFSESGLRIFGPTRKGALLEGSKQFAKELMQKARIPSAEFAAFTDPKAARDYILDKNRPLVVKADGLAAGKGVFPCRTAEEALEAVDRVMVRREFGTAGDAVVIEAFLEGEEASFICFTDGRTVLPLPTSQDHKAVFDGDRGPNTGGMGAYSPAPVITPELHDKVMKTVMAPLVAALSAEGITYKGILYAGLMISSDLVPNVLEFNVRLGDPETQPILFRLETDLVELMEAAIDQRLDKSSVQYSRSASVCVVMASEGYPGSYPKDLPITGLEEAGGLPDTMVFHAGTRKNNGGLVTAGGRVLGVTARGETIQRAIQCAYNAVGVIHWNGVHYRKDIGRKAIDR